MISTADGLAALGIGLAGAGHCLGMCGGIASALSLGAGNRPLTTVAYHLGRVCSYTALGAALGFLAGSINLAAWTLGLRYLAGVLLIAMGLAITDWWRGISVLERAGAHLWAPVQKFSGRFLPIRQAHHALALGLCWGLMPCGLIYSALAWSATAQSATESALLMLLFGLGTLPAMLATSLGAARIQTLLRRRGLKLFIGIALIFAGLWTLYITQSHRHHLLMPLPTPGAAGSIEHAAPGGNPHAHH